ncbi:MAG: hypothetical protein H0X51_02345 [Parachlamydiaceae bacterium]|nr:hypothetical protein [Parachlamydiaceae bacterium]
MVSGLGPATPENQKITFDNKSNFVMPNGDKRAVKVIVDNEQWDAGGSKTLPENVTRTINEIVDRNGEKIKEWDNCTITVYSSEHRLVLESGNQKYGDIFDKASRGDLDSLRPPPPVPRAPRPEHLTSPSPKSKTEESGKEQERPATPVEGRKRSETPPSPKSKTEESAKEQERPATPVEGRKRSNSDQITILDKDKKVIFASGPTIYTSKDVDALVQKHKDGKPLSETERQDIVTRRKVVKGKISRLREQSAELVKQFDSDVLKLPLDKRGAAIQQHLQGFKEIQTTILQFKNEKTILSFKKSKDTGQKRPVLTDAEAHADKLTKGRNADILKMSSIESQKLQESPPPSPKSGSQAEKPTIYTSKDVEAFCAKYKTGEIHISDKELGDIEERLKLVDGALSQLRKQSRNLVKNFDSHLHGLSSRNSNEATKAHLQAYEGLQKELALFENEKNVLTLKRDLAYEMVFSTSREIPPQKPLHDAEANAKQLTREREDKILKRSSEYKQDI